MGTSFSDDVHDHPHDTLLTLVVPKALSEQVEDLLLGHPELVRGFTVSEAAGHGSEARLVTAAERVLGHARQMRFQLVASAAEVANVQALLGERFAGAGIFFWVVPVAQAGRI